ncbi:Nif3-like dinuclear metal center hexameric protein [Bacillus taeanensis]|uniref:GTP cyclohydrolase 1 type 2 homolog n=1 Tax=Bacillus taeanensis TaxID=273032 RepID=A0A366XWJ3_9BACI|nr:Nif3-like dinuclear metal center hexameric protein [Bacillus taeanensis]RBW70522.1 Nif3-like dinuclear metal center hexameric protein [Bacillus taeanensis]
MSKFANGQAIVQEFEKFAPKSLAVEGDKIGLQIGTLNKPVRKVMVALDVLDEVVEEAIEEEVDLIIAHHPIIFRPLKKITTDSAEGGIVTKLIKHDIAVYAAHTNLDVAKGGVNDLMAEALQLQNTEVLVPTTEVNLKKIVVFVPTDSVDKVREALGNIGAGAIGNYSHCTFSSEGQGSFLPGEGTDPHIGEQGKLEFVDEVKIESIFPDYLEKKVINAVIKAHPYEEVAYDIYSLDNKGETLGLGRIGTLKEELTLEQFALHVKRTFNVTGVRVVGNKKSKVKKVAVLGGDGNKYMTQALFKGADVYVTGDIYYHVAHDAMLEGLNIVDPGHNVEKIMKEGVRKYLESALSSKYETEVISSQKNTDPFQFM